MGVDRIEQRPLMTQPPGTALPEVVKTHAMGMRFSDRALEAAYRVERNAKVPPLHTEAGALGVFFWMLLGFWDYTFDPDLAIPRFFPFRMTAGLVCGGVVVAMMMPKLKQHWQPLTQLYYASFLGATILVPWLAPEDLLLNGFALAGIALLFMLLGSGTNVSPSRALAVGGPIWVLYAIGMATYVAPLHFSMALGSIAFSFIGLSVSLFGSYNLELIRRSEFIAKLQAEWARYQSDQLLANMLPVEVAERLRSSTRQIAQRHEQVTVLFADLVGFTQLASEVPPGELLQLLDRVFLAFDEAAERHGVEKVKTIGDAYMAVAGAPQACSDHARRMVSFALELPEIIAGIDTPSGDPLQVRVGVHTGPVSAGVIGKKRLAFDLWGDTVNIASRMESHGQPGMVHVTEHTAAVLGGGFTLDNRGEVEVKGKGAMHTYFVRRVREESMDGMVVEVA